MPEGADPLDPLCGDDVETGKLRNGRDEQYQSNDSGVLGILHAGPISSQMGLIGNPANCDVGRSPVVLRPHLTMGLPCIRINIGHSLQTL